MDTIASLNTQEQLEREPLKYQLKTPFQNLTDGEQLKFVKKAKGDCLHVCNVIAPGNGEELFESMMSVQRELFDGSAPDDLVVLMTAYKNAKTRNLKKQILSLYAHRYPMTKLKKIHQPLYSQSTSKNISRERVLIQLELLELLTLFYMMLPVVSRIK